MGFINSQQSRILIGDYHYSPLLTDFSFGADTDMGESTTLNDAAKTFIPLLSTSTFTGSGWLDTDGAANGHLDQLNDWIADQATPLTWGPSGTALGSEVQMVSALQSQFSTGSKVQSIAEWAMAGQTDGATDFGKSLHALTAETATAVGTGLDNTAATANGGVAHLHVTAFSGFTNIIVLVEDSVDNSAWTTLVTFSTVTGVTSQRSTVAAGATVKRYLRASWTKTGTGSATFAVAFARR